MVRLNFKPLIKTNKKGHKMKIQFIDFVNTTGKNIGQIQNTKLADFIGVSEGAVRHIKNKYPNRFEILYLGAFCKVNNIKKEDLIKLIESKM
jgi:DNA-binding Xre family transcriptional regulator